MHRVKTSQGITFTETVRKVGMPPNGRSVKMADRHEMRACEGCRRVKENTLIVEKMQFILFMVDVTILRKQTRKQKIKTIVKAAEK